MDEDEFQVAEALAAFDGPMSTVYSVSIEDGVVAILFSRAGGSFIKVRLSEVDAQLLARSVYDEIEARDHYEG